MRLDYPHLSSSFVIAFQVSSFEGNQKAPTRSLYCVRVGVYVSTVYSSEVSSAGAAEVSAASENSTESAVSAAMTSSCP